MQAKSGTGKTLVFATIVLENFRKDIKAPQSLIITPTRELAVQVEQILEVLGSESSGNFEHKQFETIRNPLRPAYESLKLFKDFVRC